MTKLYTQPGGQEVIDYYDIYLRCLGQMKIIVDHPAP
jgi:hypothetical protein